MLSLFTRGCIGDGEEEAVGGPAQDEERVADRTAESPSAAAASSISLLSKMSSAVPTAAHGTGGDPGLRERRTALTHSEAEAGNVSRRLAVHLELTYRSRAQDVAQEMEGN